MLMRNQPTTVLLNLFYSLFIFKESNFMTTISTQIMHG